MGKQNRVPFNALVSVETRELIRSLAEEFGMSQGEMIDLMVSEFRSEETESEVSSEPDKRQMPLLPGDEMPAPSTRRIPLVRRFRGPLTKPNGRIL
jgi:hypothetical protein